MLRTILLKLGLVERVPTLNEQLTMIRMVEERRKELERPRVKTHFDIMLERRGQ